MKTFAQKVCDARAALGISQTELGKRAGVSLRTILSYEKGDKKPRPATLINLAKALEVSIKFLSDDECEDPMADIEKDGYIGEAREMYGARGAREMDQLLNESVALFAGGDIPMEDKQAFYDAITEAYISCKKEARERFGRKNNQ